MGKYIFKEVYCLIDFQCCQCLQVNKKCIPIPPERSMTHGARADCDWAVKSSEKQVSPYCHFQKTALNYGQNDKIVSVILFKNVFKVSLENGFIRDSQIFTAVTPTRCSRRRQPLAQKSISIGLLAGVCVCAAPWRCGAPLSRALPVSTEVFIFCRLTLPTGDANGAHWSNGGHIRGRLLDQAGVKCLPAKSTVLQRERRSGTGCQSCSSVQVGALRARPDLSTVRPSLGKTLSMCASLHCD